MGLELVEAVETRFDLAVKKAVGREAEVAGEQYVEKKQYDAESH